MTGRRPRPPSSGLCRRNGKRFPTLELVGARDELERTQGPVRAIKRSLISTDAVSVSPAPVSAAARAVAATAWLVATGLLALAPRHRPGLGPFALGMREPEDPRPPGGGRNPCRECESSLRTKSGYPGSVARDVRVGPRAPGDAVLRRRRVVAP